MSEKLAVCQALAALVRNHGEPDEEEVRFVGHAAFDLGLNEEENSAVQTVLKEGGDYDGFLDQITSKPMRLFLFRRVCAAVLLDEEITEAERSFLGKTYGKFGYDAGFVEAYLAWMREGIQWEKRGAELMARLADSAK
ncbi:MAG: hypothetical protein KC503_13725 [Myxococcales bacterium]|nr:hypothetical protein [Myxococcales bacterium]